MNPRVLPLKNSTWVWKTAQRNACLSTEQFFFWSLLCHPYLLCEPRGKAWFSNPRITRIWWKSLWNRIQKLCSRGHDRACRQMPAFFSSSGTWFWILTTPQDLRARPHSNSIVLLMTLLLCPWEVFYRLWQQKVDWKRENHDQDSLSWKVVNTDLPSIEQRIVMIAIEDQKRARAWLDGVELEDSGAWGWNYPSQSKSLMLFAFQLKLL